MSKVRTVLAPFSVRIICRTCRCVWMAQTRHTRPWPSDEDAQRVSLAGNVANSEHLRSILTNRAPLARHAANTSAKWLPEIPHCDTLLATSPGHCGKLV